MTRKSVPATLSNCGKFLRAYTTKHWRKRECGQGNDLGYGNNVWDWITCSQVLNPNRGKDAVQRLDGSGFSLFTNAGWA